LKAGALRHKVRIESGKDVQDSTGNFTRTWSTFATVRASIEPLSGKEFLQAHSINEQLTVRIRLRYLSGMDTDKRIVDTATNDIYDILAIVNVDRRNREIEIMATNTNDESA